MPYTMPYIIPYTILYIYLHNPRRSCRRNFQFYQYTSHYLHMAMINIRQSQCRNYDLYNQLNMRSDIDWFHHDIDRVDMGCLKCTKINMKKINSARCKQTCNNAVPTTCQQDAFVQRLVDNLLKGCWAQQLAIVLQFNSLSTSCEWQPCSNLIK
jgi:hypothetical protein